jgi:hypothetical protein
VGSIFSSGLVKTPPTLMEEGPLLTSRKKPNPVKSGPVKSPLHCQGVGIKSPFPLQREISVQLRCFPSALGDFLKCFTLHQIVKALFQEIRGRKREEERHGRELIIEFEISTI